MTDTTIKIFAGSSSRVFANRMCSYLGTELGRSETITFSEGSTFVRVLETVRDKDVYLVQSIGKKPNDDMMEVLFWIDAFKRASANTVTVIMPFFSYSKGDKKDEPRVSIRARVCADAIEAAGADRIVTIDLHSPQIQGFFRVPVDHLYAGPVFCKYIRNLSLSNPVIVAPDSGAAKRARSFADVLGAPVAIGDKVRRGHDEKAEILDIIGDVRDRDAIIVDDFTISCGTLADIARKLKETGAKRIFAITSHILLNETGIERLEQSPIERLFSSDTVENPLADSCPKITLISMAPLVAEATMRIENRQSITELFDMVPETVVIASKSTGGV